MTIMALDRVTYRVYVALLGLVSLCMTVILNSHASTNAADLADIEDDQARFNAARSLYGAPTINIPRVLLPVKIDGHIDELAWQHATRVAINWQISPVANIPSKFETSALVMEDGKNLYVAFDARDPNPQNIRAFLRKRDALFNDDYVAFAIDTQGDGSRAFEFFANPIGVQGDALVGQYRGEDFSYDAIFSTAGHISERGYEVEFAIPLNQIRFTKREGPQQWKMLFTRTHWGERRYQNIQYPSDPNNDCFPCQFKPAQGLTGVQPGKRFQLSPSLTANAQRDRDPSRQRSDDHSNDVDVGLEDFRWGITPDISLNATINPDFSQIEADVAQSAVNTSFVLFFPERRPFFLEGRDLFATDFNLVNTRNIANPRYGVKLSGKQGSNAFGLMSAQDRVTNFLIADFESSSTFQIDDSNEVLVARYRRDFANSSQVGFLATQRDGDDYLNRVVSADARYRFAGTHTLQAQFAHANTENPAGLIDQYDLSDETNDIAYRLNYRHNGPDSFWNITHELIGTDFRADLGFINQRDLTRTSANAGLSRRGQAGDTVSFANIGVQFHENHTEDDGSIIWRGGGAFTNVALPKDTFVSLSFFDQERVFKDVRFDLTTTNFSVRTRPFEGVSYRLRARYGDQIDVANVQPGDEFWIQQDIELNLNQHLLVRLRHTYQLLDVRGGRLFTTHLTDLRLNYQFDLVQALRLSLIHRNTKKDPSLYSSDQHRRVERLESQLLYSYRLNAQSVFFAGYSSDGIGDDQYSGIRQTFDTVFVKFTYAWSL